VTEEEERTIGELVSVKIRERFGVVQDPAVHKYVTLVGTTLAQPDAPLEILRTIHSFDPCMACAIHMVDANGDLVAEVGAGLHVHADG